MCCGSSVQPISRTPSTTWMIVSKGRELKRNAGATQTDGFESRNLISVEPPASPLRKYFILDLLPVVWFPCLSNYSMQFKLRSWYKTSDNDNGNAQHQQRQIQLRSVDGWRTLRRDRDIHRVRRLSSNVQFSEIIYLTIGCH